MTETLGRELYDRGWRQGSPLSGTAVQAIVRSLDPVEVEEIRSSGDGLVLTTQDCDLIKPETTVPVLELISFNDDPNMAKAIKPNNSRYFVMDRADGRVADRARRFPATREAVARLPAPSGPPFGGDERRARSFARWLASGYDRPALPDEVHPELAVPLFRAMEAALGPGGSHTWLNDQLVEVRVAANFGAPAPWRVALLFVLAADAAQDRCDQAIAEIIGSSGLLSPQPEACVEVASWASGTLQSISVWDYAGSAPLSMDQLSYDGDEQTSPTSIRAEPA